MPKIKTFKTDWKAIGMSGKTADSREIPATWLEEAAASYDPQTYQARINIEHLKFRWPDDELSGLGDVLALKTEKHGDQVRLLAQLEVTETLQEYWDKRQKIFSSMEIQENFAGTGKAYLTGLAVTDYPASLGTSAHFSTITAEAEKQSTILSEYTEMKDKTADKTAKAEDTPITAGNAENIFSRLFAKFSQTEKAVTTEVSTEPDAKKSETTIDLSAQEQAMELMADKLVAQAEKYTALEAEVATLKTELSNLQTKLETTATSGERDDHTGQDEIKLNW